jgi:hypothetical protein
MAALHISLDQGLQLGLEMNGHIGLGLRRTFMIAGITPT